MLFGNMFVVLFVVGNVIVVLLGKKMFVSEEFWMWV